MRIAFTNKSLLDYLHTKKVKFDKKIEIFNSTLKDYVSLIKWTYNNRSFLVKHSFKYPSNLKELEKDKISQLLTELHEKPCTTTDFTYNKISNGTCFGQCAVIVQMFLKYPTLSVKDIDLSKKAEDVIYFQSIENLRGFFHNSPKQHNDLQKMLPTPKERKYFSFASEKPWDNLLSFLTTCNNNILLIRCWNTEKERSHAIVMCSSEASDKSWFFNNSALGFYYFQKTDFLEHFSDHLKRCLPYAFEDNGHLMIEIF